MFRPDGEVRTGLIDEIVHEIDLDRLIFEAPQRHQQIWFIERYGSDVNLGNIDPPTWSRSRPSASGCAPTRSCMLHTDRG